MTTGYELNDVDRALAHILVIIIGVIFVFFLSKIIEDCNKPRLLGHYSFCSVSYIRKSENEKRAKYCREHPILGVLFGYDKPYEGNVGYPD